MAHPENVDEEQAIEQLEELMEWAHGGEEIVITRSGKPYAKLVFAEEDVVLSLLWRLEESFWKADASFYAERLDAHCIMVFPAPAGIMNGDAIVASIDQAPRWKSVSMAEHVVAIPSGTIRILAYRASAEREDTSYQAYCSSVYHLSGERWLLVSHQQTPI